MGVDGAGGLPSPPAGVGLGEAAKRDAVATGDACVPATDAGDGTDAWDGDVPGIAPLDARLPDAEVP